jgi:C-terminal processing protease CtpA/Prc
VLNDAYTAYLKSQHYDTNEYFTDTLPVNMDLNRLYVLTTSNTASASESNIIGLDPYMEVVRIGTSTHGKYCGGNLYSAEDKEISNWGMYLMTYRFANKNGVTSFTGGLEPTFEVEEDYFNLYPFGDEHDPLLGKALELITGEPYVPMRSGQTMPDVKIIQAPERHGLPYGRMISTRPLPKTQP